MAEPVADVLARVAEVNKVIGPLLVEVLNAGDAWSDSHLNGW